MGEGLLYKKYFERVYVDHCIHSVSIFLPEADSEISKGEGAPSK
jgi:hypothetical protein